MIVMQFLSANQDAPVLADVGEAAAGQAGVPDVADTGGEGPPRPGAPAGPVITRVEVVFGAVAARGARIIGGDADRGAVAAGAGLGGLRMRGAALARVASPDGMTAVVGARRRARTGVAARRRQLPHQSLNLMRLTP